MTQMTAAGAEARSVARWAWQDPEARAVDGLERVNEMAARAPDAQALAEIQDAAAMLNRLAGTVNAQREPVRLISAQLATPTITQQIELASINGHHIPGTAYTFRHGWIPVIGKIVNDKYPEWLAVSGKQKKAAMATAEAALAKGAKDIEDGKGTPPPPDASKRVLNDEQKAMLAAHKAEMARQDAAARVQVQNEAIRGGTDPVMQARMAVPPPALPGSVGEKLTQEQPALASLAAPGMSAQALKSYIDARVAAEVARQMGQITAEQQKKVDKQIDSLHRSHQALISNIRSHWADDEKEANDDLRKHTIANNIFNVAAAAVGIGGLAAGLSPIMAFVAAGIVPLVTIVHDYARNLG